ncbi:neutral/alkaline non-lysosomal ceramidase N-terminal domain-containing protein [Schlesneria sp. T3-172]|uniref:neutral/alkaline non-lysosomal ceramidase N-terminal domain-containing protein n=1 Tax=Schlesneria sphaerica TaxID=3373610 RepID=UPI0037C9A944
MHTKKNFKGLDFDQVSLTKAPLMSMIAGSIRMLVLGVALMALPLQASEYNWKAGTAKAVITPSKPLWMAGYGGRTAPAEGKLHDLYIRVLAVEDAQGHRGIVLSSDTLGIPQSIYDEVSKLLKTQYGLDQSQFMLNASHTHCGPVLKGALLDIYPVSDQQMADINEYSDWLVTEIVSTIGKAIADLEPATLSRGVGSADFGVNRRTNREPDVPSLREQNLLLGPVDHTVPVLAVKRPDGSLKAVVFIYACHNTTLAFQQWCGDYAGFAQYALEEKHPGVTALFTMGCGADQNPLPRRTVELCQEYGNRLANAVDAVLKNSLEPIKSSLATQHAMVPLAMNALPAIDRLEKMAAEPVSYTQRWAARVLKGLQSGTIQLTEYPYPVQAWKLGDDQLWVTLGGEVVVDYSLRIKAEFGEQTWVTAYSNDVMAYIPSRRVLLEGGYEGQSSMMVYGLPTDRWAEDVEERVFAGLKKVVNSLKK